jgi:hemerythrin-like domain-containing protein
VTGVLEEYNIGCGPCSVGSCLLKDIVEIHNLSDKEERELLSRIAKIIYPDRDVVIPERERKQEPKNGEIKYSPPIKKLVNEHLIIKRMVALIPQFIKSLDVESLEGRKIIYESIEFIRNYADKYHHAKEEKILFKYFDEDLDILNVMHEDHESARGYVQAILDGLKKKNGEVVAKHLLAYRELLDEHIKKEDEILYPWMDRNLSVTQVGELYSEFNKVDEEFGDEPKKYEEFVKRLEERFKPKEVKL